MSYYLAASLRQLTSEVSKKWSNWPQVGIGDGWVGDTSHQARKSDHNPDWSAGGVVRAVDIGIQGRNAKEILNEVIGDHRVWYVIYNGVIYSRTYGWAARRYTGSNPHTHHIHVSIRHGKAWEDDAGAWFVSKPRIKPGPVDYKNVRRQFLIAAGAIVGERKRLYGVKRIQYGLKHHYDKTLVVDGLVGEQTLNAWYKHEAKGGSGRPRVPDVRSLRRFDNKVWAVKGITSLPEWFKRKLARRNG